MAQSDALLRHAIKRRGGIENLPDAPDGPYLAHFHPVQLAAAIEGEIVRARLNGWAKISLHMDLKDATALAHVLKLR